MAVNVSQCRSLELDILNNAINEIENFVLARPDSSTVDLTVMLDVTEVQALSGEVASLTDNTLFINDLNTTNQIISSLNM